MQMLCKVSNAFNDVRCPVCGQGFLVYWTRVRETDRAEQRRSLQHALREQHGLISGSDAHAPAFKLPDMPFSLPEREARPLERERIPVYS